MDNWLQSLVTEHNLGVPLPEVSASPDLFIGDHSDIVKGFSSHSTIFGEALKTHSPFLPKHIETSGGKYELIMDTIPPTFSIVNIPVLKLIPENTMLPVGTVRVAESTSLADGLLVELTSERSCDFPQGAYIQRVERYDSTGKLLGELRRLRLPNDLLGLPDEMKSFSQEIQLEILMSTESAVTDIGVTIGGYSEQYGDSPLVYYVCGKNDLSIMESQYSPMVDNITDLKDYLEAMLSKYSPLLLNQN